jgi:hypothetical protein
MTAHTHSLADWLAMVCMAVSGYGAFSAPYFLLVDAARSDFDPRPALARLIESGRLDALLIAVGPALVDARDAVTDVRAFARLTLRNAALSVAALLTLLTPSPEVTR